MTKSATPLPMNPHSVEQQPSSVAVPATNEANPLRDSTAFSAYAVFLGERIDLRLLEESIRVASQPLTIPVGEEGLAILFRYGSVVLLSVSPEAQTAFLERVRPLVDNPFPQPETERLEIKIDAETREGVESGTLFLCDSSIECLQLVAVALSRSVVLSEYEKRIAVSFDRVEPLAIELQYQRRRGRKARQVLQHIGDVLLMEHKMVGRVEVSEKPELLWEHPELEPLFMRLSHEFELRERHAALEQKLNLVTRTAQTVLGLVQNGRALRVEWYIVILIVVEIILSVYQMFFAADPS